MPTITGYYGITSNTSLPISSGSKTFTVNDTGAYVVGSRIRAIASNNGTLTLNGTGHTVSLTDSAGKVTVVGEDLSFDPIKLIDSKLKTGYLFRWPRADLDELHAIWDSLENMEGKVNF